MQSSKRKWIIAFVFLVLILASIFIFSSSKKEKEVPPNLIDATPVVKEAVGPKIKSIGASVQGRKIEAYTYGTGATHIAFVGGVHGGYEWNTILLAYKFIDYLNANPTVIPSYLTVSIVPNANPDGMFKVVGKEGRFLATEIPKDDKLQASGRFNANNVDLNRNFDCEWKPESTWRGNVVSAGASVFSEPEAKVLRDFVQANKFKSVIFWHSQSGIVYGSDCENGILPETVNIMNTYAKAAGYGAVEKFDAYKVTGDSEGWLAKIGIPAITVELTNHESIEWEKNLAGMKALFTYYTPKK
jgi:predicted deacylase